LLSFLRMRRPPRSTLFLHDALPIYPSRDPGNRLSRRSGSPGLVGDPNGGKHVPHRLTSQPASITNQEEVIAMQLIQGNLRTVLLTLTLAMTVLLAAAVPSFAAEQPKLVVGGKNFTEQYIMAPVVAELLKAHGFDVEVKAGLGSGDVIFGALQRGEIDMYVEYSGTAWTGFLKEEISVGVDPDLLYQQTAAGMKERFGMEFLPERTICFSNTYVFVVTRETADKYNLSKVSDLIPIADQL